MKLLLLLSIVLSGYTSFSQTSWKGTTSTAWTTAANWTSGVPTSTSDVTIGDANFTGSFQPNITSAVSIKSITLGTATKVSNLTVSNTLTLTGNLTIGSNGTLTHGNFALTLSGNYSCSGTYNGSASSSVVFAGAAQTIGGTNVDFKILTINSTSTATLNANITADVAFNVNGVFNPNESPTYQISGNAVLNVNSTGTVKVNGSTVDVNYYVFGGAALAAGSTVDYSATATNQTIYNAFAYSTLKISGSGTKSLTSDLTTLMSSSSTAGNIYVTSGILDLSSYNASRGTSVAGGTLSVSNGATLKIGGTTSMPSNYATYTFGATSTVEYTGTSAQVISPRAFGDLILSGSGVFSVTGGTTITVADDFTISAGTLNVSNGAGSSIINITGNFTQSGGVINVSNSTGTGDINVTGNATLSGGTFNVIANASAPSTTIDITGNLSISSAGNINLESVSSASGVAVVNAGGTFTTTGTDVAASGRSGGIIDFGTGTITNNAINMAGSFTKSGTGTFGTTSTTTSAKGFVFNGTGTQNFSYSGANSQYVQYTVNSGATLNLLTGLSLLSGTTPTSTFTVNGTLDLTTFAIDATTNPTFIVSATGKLITDNTGGISAGLTGTWASKTFTTGATYEFSSTAASQSFGFTGLTMNSPGGILISNSFGTVTSDANVTFTNSAFLTVNSGSILSTAHTYTFGTSGVVTINGTLKTSNANGLSGGAATTIINTNSPTVTLGSASTIEYNSASAQTITAVNYANLTSSSTGARTLASSGTNGISATFTPGTNTYTITGSTINFNGSATQTIPAFNYNNLTSSSTGARTLAGSGTINIAGTFTPGTNTYTVTGSTVAFNGTSAQNIPAFAFNNLTINNTTGATFTGNVSVNGTTNALTFTNGKISTGSNTLSLAAAVTVAGAGAGKYVYGNLLWNIATGAQTKIFYIGDATNYTPVTTAFASVTTAGTLKANTIATEHPNLSGSGLRTDKSVNRYWTITNTGMVFTTVSVTLNWIAGDLDAGSTTANFKVGKYSSSAWTSPTVASPLATSIQATGVTSFGDFAVAEQCTLASGFSYPSSPYCSNAGSATPTITGTAGTFTSTAGLSINSTTGVVNLSVSTAGTYTVTNNASSSGGCTSSSTASITIVAAPTTSNAGPDQTSAATCGLTTVTLAGNTPSVGTGGWSIVSGTGGTVTTSTSPTSTFTGTAGTTYTLRWTISNGSCTASTDDVIISFNLSIANNFLNYTVSTNGVLCATPDENGTATLTAPVGSVFTTVGFASYGTPTGTCSSFVLGNCNASTSQSVAEGYLLGNNTANILATNTVFGDPCSGTPKKFYVQATYSQPICSGTSPGTITGTTPTGGTGTYTYYWETSTTSSSIGFVAASGTNNARDYTPGILTQTTWFRRTVTSGGCSGVSAVIQVTVNSLPAATISYTGTPYCSSAGTATVTRSGTAGGSYTSPAGLTINSSTGDITLSSSTAGTYTVTYTMINGACTATATTSVTVTTQPFANGTYPGSPFCTNGGYAYPTGSAVGAAGTLSSSAGLSINSSTGVVNLGASAAGSYIITYSVPASGGCAAYSNTTPITITAAPSATISYAASPYCYTCGTASVTRTGTAGGTYTASPAGLSLNSSTGAVTLNSSIPNTYTVTYTVAASGGCSVFTTTATIVVTAQDTDGDGIPDITDLDDDNDGIPDVIEVCGSGAISFSCLSANPAADSDGDGIVNYRDANFGTLNGAGCVSILDSDGDGIPDFLDRDSDNDGIPDVVEAFGVDANGDGIIDNFSDTDSDGLSQNGDANNTGAASSGNGLGFVDYDGDGVPNTTDLDSDNDGLPDIREALAPDTNNDGRVDGFTDANGNGLHDSYETTGALINTGADTNSDGKPNSYPNKNADLTGYPNPYDLDSDGDGIVDVIEYYGANYVYASITNGKQNGTRVNGWSTTISGSGSTSLVFVNTDGRGNPDYLDIDSDDDGIGDNIEAQPTSSYKLPADTDADNDGIADAFEVSVGTYGAPGLTPYDQDADGSPDYIDSDSDNDGAPDLTEASQLFSLTQGNINTTDTDGDGMVDQFDTNVITSLTAGVYYKNVTNSNMGANGSLSGPTPSGSNAKLVQSVAGQNRDFRNASILPLNIISFNGSINSEGASLNWKVENEAQVKYYVIERSSNGQQFDSIGVVNALNLNSVFYKYSDQLKNYTASTVYYKIRQVNKNGENILTQIILLRTDKKVIVRISLFPNPAHEVMNVNLQSEVKEVVEMRVTDVQGKTMISRKFSVNQGANSLVIPEISKLSKGSYFLIVKTYSESSASKFIIE